MKSLAEKGAKKEYQEYFYKVEAVFQHQTVFNFESYSTVPLESGKMFHLKMSNSFVESIPDNNNTLLQLLWAPHHHKIRFSDYYSKDLIKEFAELVFSGVLP